MLSVQPGLRGANDLRVGRKMAIFQFFSKSGRAKDLLAPLYKMKQTTLRTSHAPFSATEHEILWCKQFNLILRVCVNTKNIIIHKKKVKQSLLQACSGQKVSRKLRYPDFITTALESGKFVSLMHRPHLSPGNPPGTHFC